MLPFELSTVLMMIVVTGGIQFSAGKASKHSLFDVSKDIAFIPLDSQTKAQGKAAVDGLGSRMGRSVAALLHQGLFLTFANIRWRCAYPRHRDGCGDYLLGRCHQNSGKRCGKPI